MNKYVILTDSACDLNAQLRQRYDIPDYLHGIVYFPDGHEEFADLDWGSISSEQYYDSMKDKKVLYRTSCATLSETKSVFEKYLSQGYDILSISMTSALSCTYQNCVKVGEEVLKKYPDRKIFFIDSLRYSLSLGLLLSLAAEKRDQGVSIEENAEYLNKIKHCIHQMGPMDDLYFLCKTGRISNFKAFFGTLVGVNPMADFNRGGMSEVLGKFKGKTAAFDATIKYMKRTIINPSEQTIFIAHSNRESAAKILSEKIQQEFNPKEIIIAPVGMSCGSGIGPGLCAAYYVGTEISEDNKFEKAVMQNIIEGGDGSSVNMETAEEPNIAKEKSSVEFALIADSTCDLDAQLRREYGVEYVKMNYVVDDTEYPASLDWESHSAKEFYDLMRNGKHVTTTQVAQTTYREAFEAILKEGKDGVYISCSSALSGSVNTAAVVARELEETYPNNKIYCVDSLCSSLGQGMMVIMASHLRKGGKSAKETADFINQHKLCVNQVGTVNSLEYLRRAGRVKASKAFFGNIFGVKPLIISDKIGQNYAVKKVKGRANSYVEIANMIKEFTEGYDTDNLFISHADCLEDAQIVRDEILKILPFKNVTIGTIGPIVGASVGPGTIIAFAYGKEVEIIGQE